MNISINKRNVLLEMISALLLSLAFFTFQPISFIAGFFGFLVVIDLINTNLRGIKHA